MRTVVRKQSSADLERLRVARAALEAARRELESLLLSLPATHPGRLAVQNVHVDIARDATRLSNLEWFV